MSRRVSSPLLPLLLLSFCWTSHCCRQDPASAFRLTGVACRLTHPAAAVLNEKTTKVVEAAFQHARYPSVKAEKSMLIGKVAYGLDNLEIHNLTIGGSKFDLLPGEGINLEIGNVSALFNGTLKYSYGSWLVNVAHAVTFEIDSQIDLGIKPKLYCGAAGNVAADTSDCYLNFDRLRLHLQGDREPNWLKKLFTDFISFTVKMVIKRQICQEINKVANILAEFVQERAEQFLKDGDISVDINLTAPPVITNNYIESYHKGLTKFNGSSATIDDSVFHPRQLTQHRMLYFWVSDQLLNPVMAAAHKDGRFSLNISGPELADLFQPTIVPSTPQLFQKCLLGSGGSRLAVWSSQVPFLNTSTAGTRVWVEASGRLWCGDQDQPTLFFQTAVSVDVTASYAEKRLSLHGKLPEIAVLHAEVPGHSQSGEETADYITEAVGKVGIPKVLSVLESEITRLLDKQGTNLFDIYDPEVLPRDGYVLVQMDFGFPHHLLVEFLMRTLQQQHSD
ncbi:cholesteryl ester transfer protein [Synchiropus picturatus]